MQDNTFFITDGPTALELATSLFSGNWRSPSYPVRFRGHWSDDEDIQQINVYITMIEALQGEGVYELKGFATSPTKTCFTGSYRPRQREGLLCAQEIVP